MSVKVDPNLMKELQLFGLKDASKCFHCGNCTAVCPLSEGKTPFPRKLVKYVQLGLKEKILKSPEPWLCYYCGTCSEKCPRGADPGETMMVMRRYLTSQYDWTGFSRKFYTSERFEIVAILIVAVLVGIGLLIFNTGKPDWEHARLNSLWPKEKIEIADLIMAAVLSFLLLSNAYRCIKFVMGDLLGKIPFKYYKEQFRELIVHFLTQKQFSKCEDKKQWLVHLLIMTGYSTAFLLVVGLIRLFQRDHIEYELLHPIRLLGYYSTAAILYGCTYAIIGRLKKSKPPYKNSHPTDWMFLILLELTTLTGISIHFARLLDWPFVTYALYVIHLMVAVPMLVLEVPFAKWAHLAYRPIVIYMMKVREAYLKDQSAEVEETGKVGEEAVA